jgi:hypothetical protein
MSSRGRFATPISLPRIVARTEGYTYAAKVWVGHCASFKFFFNVAPCQPIGARFAIFLHRCTPGVVKMGGQATWRKPGRLGAIPTKSAAMARKLKPPVYQYTPLCVGEVFVSEIPLSRSVSLQLPERRHGTHSGRLEYSASTSSFRLRTMK